jgi:hypothetical protein
MNEITLELPEGLALSIPRDFVKNGFGGERVALLPASAKSGLTVRWDDRSIEFASIRGGVSYSRSAIKRFRVEYGRRAMHWTLCALSAELEDGGQTILSCEVSKKTAFQSLLARLVSAGVPIEIEAD